MESFAYGKPARQRSRSVPRPVVIAVGAALLALVAAGIFAVARSGGQAVARHVKDTTATADTAGDAQAQANLRLALATAKTTFLDAVSFGSAGADQLTVLEPTLTYVSGSTPSTGPGTVSVLATDQAWGAATRSSSGTCFWVRATVSGGTAYGSGDPCTGEAAMGATSRSFPS